MLATTTNSLQGHHIQKYYGIISATAVVGGEDRDTLIAALDAAADGVSAPYERLEHEARIMAMDRMRDRAAEVGANGIIGIHAEHRNVDAGRSISIVYVTGTAVLV